MWWDSDIDARMARTAARPIPTGRVEGGEALAIGIALSGFSVVMLALFANLFAAALLAFTIFFYAVVYSMWLKRATPQARMTGSGACVFAPFAHERDALAAARSLPAGLPFRVVRTLARHPLAAFA